VFGKQLGDQIKVTPTVKRSYREAKVTFLTDLAQVTLTLSASANSDATRIVLDYDLAIIPAIFDYERHARLEMPIDKIDTAAISAWIDDRLISCVKVYLSIQDNQFYINRVTVEDPISKARFIRTDAAGTLEHNGQTVYFASEQTMHQYKDKLGIS
jgi:YHS domain-containing protein